MSRGLIYRVPLSGEDAEPFVETGGGPNGLTLGPEGTVWVAQNGNATIQSRSPRPVRPGLQTVRDETVADPVTSGCAAPNDLVFGPDGLVWFTDPGKPSPCVRTYDPESGALSVAYEGLAFPNGLAFGADGEELYVADSESDDIVCLYRRGKELVEPRVHARLPGASPDGIAFDADGMLYVAGFDSDDIRVVDTSGSEVERIQTGAGSHPSNLCFAGDDLGVLVVTAVSGGRVLAHEATFPGRSPTPWLDV